MVFCNTVFTSTRIWKTYKSISHPVAEGDPAYHVILPFLIEHIYFAGWMLYTGFCQVPVTCTTNNSANLNSKLYCRIRT